MTKEEAIKHIKAVCHKAIDDGYDSAIVDACSMAVEALEGQRTGQWKDCERCVHYGEDFHGAHCRFCRDNDLYE